MKQNIIITVSFLCCIIGFSQNVFFSTGKNFTSYDFKNSLGEENPNVKGSNGSFYEMGYFLPVVQNNNNLKYGISITLNAFNATGGTNVDYYNWDTNYLGLQNTIKYDLLGDNSNFEINLLAAFNINTLISGEQKINGQTFNLKKSDEFKGLFIQPLLGVDFGYFITDNILAGFGFNLSKNFGISNKSDQKLNFNNSQLQFIFNYYLN